MASQINSALTAHRLFVYSLASLFIGFVFIDGVRRYFENSLVLLMLLDANLLACYVILFWYMGRGFLARRNVATIFICSLVIFVTYVLILTVNVALDNPIVALASLRTYLLAIPSLGIGLYIYNYFNSRDYSKAYKYILWLSIIVILFGVLQQGMDRSLLPDLLATLLTPMSPGIHGYGDEVVQLTTSFFASSKRYSSYLLFSYLVLWGIAKNNGGSIQAIFILFLFGLVIGGAREGLWLFVIFNILGYFLFAIKSKNRILIYLISILSILVLTVIIFIFYDQTILGLRGRFLLGMDDDLLKRLSMLFPFTNIIWDNNQLLTGMGPGSYGQEAQLVPHLLDVAHDAPDQFFYQGEGYSRVLSFIDSGLTKIIIELGFIGLLIYSFVLFGKLIVCVRAARMWRLNYLNISLAFYVMSWIILFLKAHSVISSIMLSFFLFVSLGYLLCSHTSVRGSLKSL